MHATGISASGGYFTWRNAIWFPDGEHILIAQDGKFLIYNWRDNQLLMTIYLLPESEWAMMNHQTGCWKGSGLAFQYLECRDKQKNGKNPWLTVREYEKLAGEQRCEERVPLILNARE